MKNIKWILIAALSALSLLSACSAKNSAGSVSTDGSTSMEKVIGTRITSAKAEPWICTFAACAKN